MANSASDARHSEADIRKTLIEKNLIYAMLTLPSNMFYTVTLPATLWFFEKGKKDDEFSSSTHGTYTPRSTGRTGNFPKSKYRISPSSADCTEEIEEVS